MLTTITTTTKWLPKFRQIGYFLWVGEIIAALLIPICYFQTKSIQNCLPKWEPSGCNVVHKNGEHATEHKQRGS